MITTPQLHHAAGHDLLCTLRRGRRLPRRNTHYWAGATPYPGRTFTGWIAPAWPGALDNLSTHKTPAVQAAIEDAGASLPFLPAYSPDFNPIENAFSKLKAALRKAAARTVPALWQAIAIAIDSFTPLDCANYFAAAGYEPD